MPSVSSLEKQSVVVNIKKRIKVLTKVKGNSLEASKYFEKETFPWLVHVLVLDLMH